MSVQWSEDLESVVRQARSEAKRYDAEPNSAILLKSLLDCPGFCSHVLRNIGLSDQALHYALSHYQFRGESPDTVERLLERAARLASCSREEEVSSGQLLMAILDEPCVAQALLEALNLDLNAARQLIFGASAESLVNARASGVYAQSFGASALRGTAQPLPNRKSPTVIPVTTFSPGSEPTIDFIPMSPQPNVWVSPDGVVSPKSSQVSDRGALYAPAAQSSERPAQKPLAPRRPEIPKKPVSVRESQQATAVDLAKRIKRLHSQEISAQPVQNEAKPKQVSPQKDQRPTQSSVKAQKNGPVSRPSSTEIQKSSQRRAPQETKAAGGERRRIVVAGFNPTSLSSARFPNLCRYGRNLLAEAKAGKLDPVIEREREMEQLADILSKRRSNNPILIGEPGVGKTAIVEGLALKMAQNKAPKGFEQHTIIALDYGSFMCGTQLRGAVQDRLNAIKAELKLAQGQIILFLDEIHCWLGSSSDASSDIAADLKLALARGELVCIGATTAHEFKRAVDADPAFERRFDVIEVKAPDVKTSIRIISDGIIEQYAQHHAIAYSEQAVVSAVKLSERYIKERTLPDKALSVLDRAGSIAKRSGDREVGLEHVARVIAQLAEIPLEMLLMSENEKLLKMEGLLGSKLIGHAQNIEKIAQVIRRNQAGFGAHRPIGSFLFLGPTGVGKTEAAKVLADFLFGSKNCMVRFDMSEYMEQHSVAKLIGSPAGYVGFDEGGLLTEALRKHPYQIVLFDEIEKAHPDVANILLQILDEGRLSDAKGRSIDFSNTVIVMTSNLGVNALAQAAHKGIGFAEVSRSLTDEEAQSIILRAARAHFSPELWNRIEEKLVFLSLSLNEIKQIAQLLLKDSADRLFYDKKIQLEFAPEIIDFLIEHGGYAPAYGARPMRRTIQSHIESRIAEYILSHEEIPAKLKVKVGQGCIVVGQD